jgi:hypothetical protein
MDQIVGKGQRITQIRARHDPKGRRGQYGQREGGFGKCGWLRCFRHGSGDLLAIYWSVSSYG